MKPLFAFLQICHDFLRNERDLLNLSNLGDTNLTSRLTGGRLQIWGSVGRNNNNDNPEIGKYMLNSKRSVTIKEDCLEDGTLIHQIKVINTFLLIWHFDETVH